MKFGPVLCPACGWRLPREKFRPKEAIVCVGCGKKYELSLVYPTVAVLTVVGWFVKRPALLEFVENPTGGFPPVGPMLCPSCSGELPSAEVRYGRIIECRRCGTKYELSKEFKNQLISLAVVVTLGISILACAGGPFLLLVFGLLIFPVIAVLSRLSVFFAPPPLIEIAGQPQA